MSRSLVVALALLPAALLPLAVTGSAHAAALPRCVPATLRPRADTIPVNLPGFGYTALQAKPEDVHLRLVSTGAEVPLTFGAAEGGFLKMTPSTPLTPGEKYTLEIANDCFYGASNEEGTLTFTAAPEAPLPTTLGAPSGTPTVQVEDFGATKFTITAQYVLAEEMKPWSSVYQVALAVDGRMIETTLTPSATSGNPTAGTPVTATAIGWCDDANAATETHSIMLRARLPFAPAIETEPTTLTFSCPKPRHVTPTPGAVPPLTGGDSSTPPTPGATPVGKSDASGCAVGVTPSKSAALGCVLIVLGSLVRRRASASTQTRTRISGGK